MISRNNFKSSLINIFICGFFPFLWLGQKLLQFFWGFFRRMDPKKNCFEIFWSLNMYFLSASKEWKSHFTRWWFPRMPWYGGISWIMEQQNWSTLFGHNLLQTRIWFSKSAVGDKSYSRSGEKSFSQISQNFDLRWELYNW